MNTKRIMHFIVTLMAAVVLIAEEPETADNLMAKVRAQALPVARELMQTLEGRLMEAMQNGGPVAAIEVCQKQALELTETVRREEAIAYLKRVGVRIRNPLNQPDSHEQRALDHFLSEATENGSFPEEWMDSIILPDGSRQIRYYRAIPMQARCLPCHGPDDNLPEKIRTALDQRYPDDAARGFELGQLRGLLVVGLHPDSVE